MTANMFLDLVRWLNETIDRLFCFELEDDEIIGLTATGPRTIHRKGTDSTAR
jgi:hypothetical protein